MAKLGQIVIQLGQRWCHSDMGLVFHWGLGLVWTSAIA